MATACPPPPKNLQYILYFKEELNYSLPFYILLVLPAERPTSDPAEYSPDSLGESLNEVRVEEANGPGHRLVNPLIILLSQVAHLPQERLLPVHQVLQETDWTLDIHTSGTHFHISRLWYPML